MQQEQLTKLVEQLSAQLERTNSTWAEVHRRAREYEMMRLHGTYLTPTGSSCLVSPSEQVRHTEFRMKELMDAIARACREEGITGSLLVDK